MRLFLWISLFIFFGKEASGQGFERILPDSLDGTIREIRLVSDNIIELDFSFFYSGPGLDGGNEMKAWYYIDSDSLGSISRYSNTFFAGRFDQLLIRDSLWLTFGHDNTSCGGRDFLNLEVLNLGNWNVMVPSSDKFPYIAGAYNVRYLNDTIFGYYGQESCLQSSPARNLNDTLIYYWLDLKNGQINPIDTVSMPFSMLTPGSLVHDSSSHQNILFYDSLRFYLSPGKKAPDSIVIDTSIWSTEYQYSFQGNFNRHYNSFTYKFGHKKFFKRINDTLNAYEVVYREDWLGQLYVLKLPKLAEYPSREEDMQGFLVNRESDSVLTYGIIPRKSTSQRLDLFRLVNGEVKSRSRYTAPPDKIFSFSSVTSDQDGNFYIGGSLMKKGNRSYWFPDPEELGYYNMVLIKVDKNGQSREIKDRQNFSLQQISSNTNRPLLSFKTADPTIHYSYRIADLSGRSLADGKAYAGDLISIERLSFGIYYFQLWQENGPTYGQQAFIKT
tara:strand:- start:1288 stop:2787 length:1500 start_codon:yes stop_codon:yes gene_type:complete